jgi:flagellar protein FliO/FliZ
MRAFSGGGGSANLEMLAQLPLGTRERAVLVRVGDTQVLIGVAPGSVRTLHVLGPSALPLAEVPAADAAAAAAAAAPAMDQALRPTFKALLLRSLGK